MIIEKVSESGVSRVFLIFFIFFTADGLTADGSSFSKSHIITAETSGRLTVFQNYYEFGVAVLLEVDTINGQWRAVKNKFISNGSIEFEAKFINKTGFFRSLCLEVSPTAQGFTNLINSYGILTTIAGAGGTGEDINKWRAEFEGGLATNALLSRPHISMADKSGNIYIADKGAHAIRKVDRNGIIYTVAGINSPGDGDDNPALATGIALNQPNGLFVLPDGVVYILDLGNLKIRRLDTNGIIQTICYIPDLIVGRGIWVTPDESTIYIASGTVVYRWTNTDGLDIYATGFTELGNIAMAPDRNLVVTDRAAHKVIKIMPDGSQIVIAGNGMTYGGGDGYPATQTALNEVRGVWFLPDGSFFVCTHRGSQVWYIDRTGIIHLFLNGYRSTTHGGDGTWFYNPYEYRVSEVRSVVVDYEGNILITENDSGYVRRIQFLWRGE